MIEFKKRYCKILLGELSLTGGINDPKIKDILNNIVNEYFALVECYYDNADNQSIKNDREYIKESIDKYYSNFNIEPILNIIDVEGRYELIDKKTGKLLHSNFEVEDYLEEQYSCVADFLENGEY